MNRSQFWEGMVRYEGPLAEQISDSESVVGIQAEWGVDRAWLGSKRNGKKSSRWKLLFRCMRG